MSIFDTDPLLSRIPKITPEMARGAARCRYEKIQLSVRVSVRKFLDSLPDPDAERNGLSATTERGNDGP